MWTCAAHARTRGYCINGSASPRRARRHVMRVVTSRAARRLEQRQLLCVAEWRFRNLSLVADAFNLSACSASPKKKKKIGKNAFPTLYGERDFAGAGTRVAFDCPRKTMVD